jgi:hypothetical protein
MAKKNIYIVLMHSHALKSGSKSEWETNERVEFVDNLRKRHISFSTAIGDYTNKKMISGSRYNINDYNQFEEYLKGKYPEQMKQLDKIYGNEAAVIISDDMVDEFGNKRAKTVFDV